MLDAGVASVSKEHFSVVEAMFTKGVVNIIGAVVVGIVSCWLVHWALGADFGSVVVVFVVVVLVVVVEVCVMVERGWTTVFGDAPWKSLCVGE